ncbi:hypothetical protein MRX96_003922 [Rhipicephalus microplus]
MGAPAFMKEFREFMNFNSDGGLFGGSTQSRLGSCDSCLTKFGLLKRRHACDQCGTDFCAACHHRWGAREKGELVDLLLAGVHSPSRCLHRIKGGSTRMARAVSLDRARRKAHGIQNDLSSETLQSERKGKESEWKYQYSQGLQPMLHHPNGVGHFLACPPKSPFQNPLRAAAVTLEMMREMSPQSSVPRYEMALEHFESVDELGQLTVMQMKLMLTRNFVDYRGCCEKAELLEKLSWLWQQKRKHQGDALCEEDMCKICMEGCVDCVILDCGHMCTCTGCGKQLSECPICRQFVVRVVHVFRA